MDDFWYWTLDAAVDC